MIKVPKWFIVGALCMFGGFALAGTIKVWSTSEKVKASDLNANFAYIMNNFVGGQGARLVDADVTSSAGIQWTKLASGGASSVGSFSLLTASAMSTGTSYGGFQMAGTASSGIKFGEVTCTDTSATNGTGTNGTLAIYDTTSSANLCSGTFTCGIALDVPQAEFNCNTAPVSGHMYTMRITTGCGTRNPTGMICVVEMIH